ncbi:hypothetical protein DFJ73DRAFT_961200 [Zopfochytrium polystomum]|nr:hypothetical protein DFJ73DRAFT_961200 [Zopfochytrium polystomum]
MKKSFGSTSNFASAFVTLPRSPLRSTACSGTETTGPAQTQENDDDPIAQPAFVRHLARLTVTDLQIEELVEEQNWRKELVTKVLKIKLLDKQRQEAMAVLASLREALRDAKPGHAREEIVRETIKAIHLIEREWESDEPLVTSSNRPSTSGKGEGVDKEPTSSEDDRKHSERTIPVPSTRSYRGHHRFRSLRRIILMRATRAKVGATVTRKSLNSSSSVVEEIAEKSEKVNGLAERAESDSVRTSSTTV